jgi:flavin-dependent dehydrogenase
MPGDGWAGRWQASPWPTIALAARLEGDIMQTSTQVLVIGGGPAGSIAATLLVQEGFDVTLLEKDIFPRYHVGESLLPSCLEILDLIGAREKIEAHGFILKKGGYFAWGKDAWVLNFDQLRHPYGYQVVRSEFDQELLEHAKSQGVKVYEGTEVKTLSFDGDRPRSATWAEVANKENTGEIAFDFLIDASGRAGIMANRYLKNRHIHEAFQNVATWGYWQGTIHMDFAPSGALAVGSLPYGWLWAIPIHDGTSSVGLVQHKTSFKEKRQQGKSLEDMLMEAIAECPLIADLLQSGTYIKERGLRTEQDFSYMSDDLSGPGYFLVGDAACFIDPLLSTGVHLATHAAMLAAASIASALRGDVTEEQARMFFEHSYRHAYLRLMVIISGLYQQYNGKDAYFWQAQQLTHNDYSDPTALNEAFMFVVSGMEDLKDIEEAVPQQLPISEMAGQLPAEEAQRAMAMYNVYNKVFLRSSMSEKTAIDNMYVTTKPHLGIATVGSEQATPA